MDMSRLEHCFHEISKISNESEKNLYLRKLSQQDSELSDLLLNMLETEDESGPVDDLAITLVRKISKDFQSFPSIDLNQKVGHFRLLYSLGRGGMGEVFLAEREDGQFLQQVALKMMRNGLSSESARQHFLNERQILAQLQHPNIARLIDGGLTEDGTPWFAMEYVQGNSLLHYANENQLTISQRIKLFQQVLSAVEHAHHNLIIHQDIKPDNILVTESEQLKLLDFGIAKITEQEDARTGLTQMASGTFLTPAYASPEQIRNQRLSIATDIYALGTVLFELISGSRPFDVKGKSPAQLEQIICETPAPALYERYRQQLADKGSAWQQHIQRSRRAPPKKLKLWLTGDLATIVQKCLNKDSHRRYPNCTALFEDLQRLLEKRPVLAKPDSALYRIRLFIQRRTLLSALSFALVMVLITGISSTIWQGQIAKKQRDLAQQEATKSKQITEYLVNMFKAADPAVNYGNEVSAETLLSQALITIEKDLSEQKDVQSDLLDVMGQVYTNLGSFDKAKSLFERSLNLHRDISSPPDKLLAVQIHLAWINIEQGQYQLAMDALKQVVKDLAFKPEHPLLAEAEEYLGLTYYYLDDLDLALQYFQQADAQHIKTQGTQSMGHANMLNYMGVIYGDMGDYKQAENNLRTSLQIHFDLLDENNPELATAMNDLAVCLYEQDKMEEAERWFRQALKVRKKALGDQHSMVATSYNNYANVLSSQKKYDESLRAFEQALAIRMKLFGPSHLRTTAVQSNLGLLLMDMNQLDRAEQVLRAACTQRLKIAGGNHRGTLICQNNLGMVLLKQEKLDEAESFLTQTLNARQTVNRISPTDLAVSYRNLAFLRLAQHQAAEAETLLKKALDDYAKVLKPTSEDVRITQLYLSESLNQQGKLEEARQLFDTISPFTKQLTDQSPHYPVAQKLLGLKQPPQP